MGTAAFGSTDRRQTHFARREPHAEQIMYGSMDPLPYSPNYSLIKRIETGADRDLDRLVRAVLVSAEATHAVLGIEQADIKWRMISIAEMADRIRADDTDISQKQAFAEAKETAAQYDQNSGIIYINQAYHIAKMKKDAETGIMEASATTIHELLHQYCDWSTSDAAMSMNDVVSDHLYEGATEYTAIKILDMIAGQDAVRGIDIGYKAGYDFFVALEKVVGAETIVNAFVNSSLDAIADKFDDISRVTRFDGLVGRVDQNGNWDANAGTHFLNTFSEAMPADRLPDNAVFSISLKHKLMRLDVGVEAQARTLTDMVVVMSGVAPNRVVSISPDMGPVNYTMSADNMTASWNNPIGFQGASWNVALIYTSEETRHDENMLETLMNRRGVDKQLVKLAKKRQGKNGFDEIAFKEKVRIRPRKSFDGIRTRSQLLAFMQKTYPPATAYYQNMVTTLAETELMLENDFGFPLPYGKIAEHIQSRSLAYQEKALVQPTVYELVNVLLRGLAGTLSAHMQESGPLKGYLLSFGVTGKKPYDKGDDFKIVQKLGLESRSALALFLISKARGYLSVVGKQEPTIDEVGTVAKAMLCRIKNAPQELTEKTIVAAYLAIVRETPALSELGSRERPEKSTQKASVFDASTVEELMVLARSAVSNRRRRKHGW